LGAKVCCCGLKEQNNAANNIINIYKQTNKQTKEGATFVVP